MYWRARLAALPERGVLRGAVRVWRTGRHAHLARRRSSASARGCAGGCTSASSGAACWRWRSPSRWSSAGSTSARAPDDQMTYVTYLFGFPGGLVPLAHRRSPGCSSTASTSPRCWCWPASRSRSGAGCATGARRRCSQFAMDFFPLILLFAISVTGLALTVSHAVAARQLLQLPRDPARDHGDRRAALSAVRKVLPHLPAAGAARRQALPGRGRRGCGRALRALRRALRLADAHRRPARACCRSWASTTRCRGRRDTGRTLCPACKRKTLAIAQLRIKEEARG